MFAVQGLALGIGIAMGFAVLGAGIGQGLAANGALSGMARQPSFAGKIQTGMFIALAFVESLVIFTMIFCFMLVGKIPDTTKLTPEQIAGKTAMNQEAPASYRANMADGAQR